MKEGFTLQERNGWLYIASASPQYSEPRMGIDYYPLGVGLHTLCSWTGSMQSALARLGGCVQDLGSGLFRDAWEQEYRLINAGATRPEFCEMEGIPEPVQRGRKLPVAYRQGAWWKHTRARGWVKAY